MNQLKINKKNQKNNAISKFMKVQTTHNLIKN